MVTIKFNVSRIFNDVFLVICTKDLWLRLQLFCPTSLDHVKHPSATEPGYPPCLVIQDLAPGARPVLVWVGWGETGSGGGNERRVRREVRDRGLTSDIRSLLKVMDEVCQISGHLNISMVTARDRVLRRGAQNWLSKRGEVQHSQWKRQRRVNIVNIVNRCHYTHNEPKVQSNWAHI